MHDIERRSDDQRRRDALKWLAVARQVSDADPILGTVYLQSVKDCDPDLLQAACEQLGKEPRDEFRPAMPDVGTILARVSSLARARAEAASQARQLAPAPNERLYRCWRCEDDPAGWMRPMNCPEIPCGRRQAHSPHVFSARCPCWLERNREGLEFSKQEALKGNKRIPPECHMLADLAEGRYRWAKPESSWRL